MGSNNSVERQQDNLGDVVSSDGPDDRPEQHQVPFALVLERSPKGNFHQELREAPDPGATELLRPAPNVTLAK